MFGYELRRAGLMLYVIIVLLLMLSGMMVQAQDGGFATVTPEAAVAAAGTVENPADDLSEDGGGILETITGQVLIFATAAVLVTGCVLLVMFIAFIRAVVPALKASLDPAWQPVLFPVLDGIETTVSNAAMDLAKRIQAEAAKTNTPIDDDLIATIIRSLQPPSSIKGETFAERF